MEGGGILLRGLGGDGRRERERSLTTPSSLCSVSGKSAAVSSRRVTSPKQQRHRHAESRMDTGNGQRVGAWKQRALKAVQDQRQIRWNLGRKGSTSEANKAVVSNRTGLMIGSVMGDGM